GSSLIIGGFQLALNGGSIYYPAAGAAVVASAAMLILKRGSAFPIYGGLIAVTILWSLWEVGLDGWALAPRILALSVLALAFLIPPVRMRAEAANPWWVGAPVAASAAVFVLSGMAYVVSQPDLPQAGKVIARASGMNDWRHWGGTLGGTRYSPINEINAETVKDLEIAWRYESDVPPSGPRPNFQVTPLAVEDKLYLCLDRNIVVALDQDTGEEVWRFDPHTNLEGLYGATCRGVSYFEAPSNTATECPKRVLLGTADARLIAIDAESGAPCPSFGDAGEVYLLEGFGEQIGPGMAFPTSPATIVNGVAVVGQFILDFLSQESPSGVVRGYDALTGNMLWAWDAGRPDRTGLPPEGETYTPNTPNSWTVASGDEELGLVFIPTGNSPPDWYGADRSEASENYSSSIVAIDVKTGKERWSFQTVRHDLWDYDLGSQPVAFDITTGDVVIPALVIPTKQAQLFLLDRRDGSPIDPIENRPVPQGGAPGDWTSATQPFPTSFAPVTGPDLTERHMWGLTPLDQLWCRIRFRKARYEGIYTPPGVEPYIQYPGASGGNNWGSVAVDTDRGLMAVPSLHMANYSRLIPRDQLRTSEGFHAHTMIYPQEGKPYAFEMNTFLSPLGAPCQQPPYFRMTVFDIDTRELVWSKPLGTAEKSGVFGLKTYLPVPMGPPGYGGAITSGGLIFISAVEDQYFRAIDIADGKTLWRDELPALGVSVPMTYHSERSGRQFVVIASGSYPAITPSEKAYVVAYALPEPGE
ncbi:MAG: membrane-bound PQQ-dependent dehydrogenase, glucose/quinate/shikimate family, partial [Gammaproteobacteria bacterium]|nr:membrane-bound PQQ-dependent dehydrogenase, glucose/quinate/shikimate family [Gammaproteobacteria bacterium]